MPIVDGELTGEGVGDTSFAVPDLPLGMYIESCIRRNVSQHGDCSWLVRRLLSLNLTRN